MKNLVLSICVLIVATGYTQTCEVTVTGPTQVCPGMPVTITATGTITQPNQAFDFNNSQIPGGWNSSGGTNYGSLCGQSMDNTPYFWASTAVGTPQITTAGFNVCSGGTIEFEMRYAIQGGNAPCEGPDEQDEGVSLQYSINGGATWVDIIYYSPWGFTLPSNPGGNASINGVTPFTTWNGYAVPIPAAALTTNTMFRWIQVNSSGGCCDNWGLDNVFINAGPCLTANIGWDVTGANTPTGNTITIPVYSDTLIVAGVYDDNGVLMCVSAPFPVTVFTPYINGGPDQTVCWGENVTLSGTSGTNFVWNNGVTNGVVFNPTTTQTYTVNGIDANGCPDSDEVLVTVNPQITYTLSYPNPAYCIDAVDPTPTLSTALVGTYSIAPNSVTINPTTGVIDLSSSTTTTSQAYTVSFTPTNGCYAVATTQLTINTLPVVNAGSDVTICNGASTVLTATGASSYAWSNGVNTATNNVSPTVNSTFTVTGTNTAGCTNTDQVLVSINPLPLATIAGNVTVCLNAPSPTVTFTGSNGTAPYTFSYSYNAGAVQQITSNAAGIATITVPTSTSGNHVYELTQVTESSGTTCSNNQTGTTTVIVNPLPNATITGTTAICQNSAQPQVTFTGSNAVSPYTFTYTLNGGAPQTISTAAGSNSIAINVPTTVVGNYVYQLVSVVDGSANSCSVNVSTAATVVVNPLPSATIAGTISLCQFENNPQVTLTGTNGNAPYIFTYTINNGAPQVASSLTGQVTLGVPTNIPGTYTYNLISVQESSSTACLNQVTGTATVTVFELPVVHAGIDHPVCAGFTTQLSGSGANSYVWNHNVTNGDAFYPQSTLDYIVVGTDLNNCSNQDTVRVTVIPIPVVNFTASLNEGCSPLQTVLTNHSTGNLVDCQWSLSNGMDFTGCGTIDVNIAAAGCYDVTLTVSTPEGCTNTETVPAFLCVYPNPLAEFELTPSVLETTNTYAYFFNNSVGASTYHWDFGDGFTSSDEQPTHQFPDTHPGEYVITLTATSMHGCVDTVAHGVRVNDELIYYVPNTFTPDGDEFNNAFTPVLTAGFDTQSYRLEIYNRWGQLIFESQHYEQGWDGTYDGELQKEGVYGWKIYVKKKYDDEKVELQGHVNLLK